MRHAGGWLGVGLVVAGLSSAWAQDATWLASPGTNDFGTGANWTTATVPTGTATFSATGTPGVSLNGTNSLGGITFGSAAPAYTLTLGGSADVTLTGAGVINSSANTQTIAVGGTLNFNGSSSGGGAGVVYNITGAVNFNDAASAGSATYTVSGPGGFLALDDSSTAGGATVTVSGGSTMCFCNDATAGTANITVTGSGSTLQFSNNTAAGAATITGGTGATVQFLVDGLASAARYIGAGGTLDASSLTTIGLGSIEGSGTIDLGSAALTVGGANLSTTFSGVVEGAGGSLVKTGTGTLTLSGANTYSGGTTVNQGVLTVTGSLASGVTVGSGGTLGGSGTITGAVVNSGTVAPGTFDTLSIAGNYTQNGSGAYRVAVNGAGQAGRIAITGNAILNGAVNVQAASGSYNPATTYTILTATGTITGTFSSVTSTLAFLTPSLSYNTHDVVLTLTRAANAFSNGARTGNQRSVGAVLDQASATATGDFATVLNAISVLDTTQGPRVLDAIGGQNYSGFSTAAVQSAAAFMNAFASRVGSGNGGNDSRVAMLAGADDACDAVCDTDLPRWGAWGGGIGGTGTIAGDASSHGTTYSFGGFAGGLDYRFDPAFLAGVAVGYTSTSLYTQDMPGTGSSGTVQIGVYGQFTAGRIYVDGLAGYARGQNQMQRPVAIPGLAMRTASGQTTVDQFFGQIETGYKIELGGTARAFVTPFARLQGSTATQAAFSETGAGSLNLDVAGQTTNSLRTVVGTVVGAAVGKATARLRLGWSHEFADTARPVTASFAGAPALSFTTMGAAAPREGAVLGLSADAPLAEQTSLYARYDADLAGGNTSHLFSAGVRYVW